MLRVKPVFLFCAVAICLGAALRWALRPSDSSLPNTKEFANLWIAPGALNMGTIWEDDQFTWRVPIENHEAETVEVLSFSATCNCLSVEPESFVLGAGEGRDLRVQINLTSQVKPSGEISVGLWAHLKKEARKPGERLGPKWHITGQVRKVLGFNRHVYLGQHSELAQPLPVRTIPIDVLVPLESLSAQCDLAGFTASAVRPEAGKAVLRISWAPRPLGAFEGTVRLLPVLKGGEKLPAQSLRFEGKIVADVEAVPAAVQVGGRVLGETFEEVVNLRSLTGRPLEAVQAEPEGDGLAVEAVEANQRFCIRQKVARTGSCTNRAHFYTQTGGRKVEIIVPVSYTGVESN